MTRQGPRKSAGGGHCSGRHHQARAFRESARSLVMIEDSSTYNPAITLMVGKRSANPILASPPVVF